MKADNVEFVFVVVQTNDANGVSIVCTVTVDYRRAWDHISVAAAHLAEVEKYRKDYYNSLPDPAVYRPKQYESIIGSWCLKSPAGTTTTYQIWREPVVGQQ